MELDDAAGLDAADPDQRLPDAVVDKMVEDAGELFDGEKEGGDERNEQSFKRPHEAGESPDTKKAKPDEEAEPAAAEAPAESPAAAPTPMES